MLKKSSVNIPAIQVIRTIVFLFIGLVVFFMYSKTVEFLTASPLFAVHDVLIDSSIQFIDMAELRRLKGRNIFKTDIHKLEVRIKTLYPQIAQLRVVRELPDRIKVLAKKRDVFFQIPLKSKFLLVDQEGVALYYVPAAQNVPMVQAAGERFKAVLGAPLNSRPIKVAVQILLELKAHPRTAPLKITMIDAGNLSKIQVSAGDQMHLILDQDHVSAKIDMLDSLLAQKKVDFTQIKYIDLRFNEPVLGSDTGTSKAMRNRPYA